MEGDIKGVIANGQVIEEKLGIPWCMNCVGWHPDKIPGLVDYAMKVDRPQTDVMVQLKQFDKWETRKHYKNKSCMICGRSYGEDGELDKTWDMTARRVKEELQRVGLYGVDDSKVNLIVARCRKSTEFLIKNRFGIPIDKWERFTFSGCLALIITHALEARKSKVGGGLSVDNIKGTVRPGKL